MDVVVLKVILVVWVLLSIIYMVLAVLEELVRDLAPLAVKCTRNSKGNVFIVANIAMEHVIFFNINIVLA